MFSSYLPQQLEGAEMEAAIAAAFEAVGAASVKDMGKVIGKLRADYAGRMDFAKASGMVKERLASGA